LAQKHPQIAEAALLLQELILRRLAQEANDLEARLLVVMIPTKLQVEPEDDQERINAVAATLGLEGRELHFDDRIVERVLNMCRSNQIPIADMGPALRQAARDGVAAHCTGCTVPVLPFTLDGARSYWRQGWHLSVEGNAIVAGQIYEYLQAHPQLLAVERQR
jgi:ribosome modulation factor